MKLPSVEHDHPEASANREVRFGAEIEVPLRPEDAKPLTSVGERSDDREFRDLSLDLPGQLTHEWIGGSFLDKEYGLEARSRDGGVPYYELPEWYRGAIAEIEEKTRRKMEPTGFFGTTTAGVHVHISPITEDQARELWELSGEPWMQVFASTSLAERDIDGSDVDYYPVLRAGRDDRHIKTDKFDCKHDSVVNKHRKGGVGHYEWRLPEPMPPEHFDLIVEFLVRFMDDTDEAAEWAENLVRSGDRRLTAFKRADAIEKEIHLRHEHTTRATAVMLDVL